MKDVYSFCIIPTTRCNLKCKHCYTYTSLAGYPAKAMDCDMVRGVVKGISLFLEKCGTYNLSVPIVGGEPMLVPPEVNRTLFETLYEEIGKNNPGFVIFFNTNLIFLSEEHMRLFSEFPVNICASFDPGDVRFPNEKMFKRWCYNVSKLADAIGERLYVAVTVCEPIFKTFDLYAFLRELGVKNLMLSEFSPLGNALLDIGSFFVSRRRLSLGLIAFSETRPEWLNIYFTKEDLIRESKFFENGVRGGVECWNDCFNTFSVLPDGGVTFAGFCFSSEILGNIVTDPPEKILYHPLRLEFMLRKTAFPECLSCEYKDFCRCGCVSLSKIKDSSDCPGLKVYLDYVFKDIIPEDFYDFVKGTWFEKYLRK